MKRVILILSLAALLMIAAVPAIAQVTQGVGGDTATSGNVTTPFTATNSGDSSNQCASALQFGNTGNNQPAQGVLQYGSQNTSGFGGINETGGGFAFNPSNNQTCDQTVQQSSAASSY